ncbi:restriction endonuclease subunit S [Haemophilus parahaemolyticus]|uniref:restriction endonuclease subunit S n=1 Tax=Haemophilus parahaemolyticus TaxID=735 RepID=UPI00288A7765|nr:restriction endonuclease subunit S [Haemophilus parahaemolyticus]
MSDWKEYTLGDISRNISRRFDFNAYPNVVFINTGDVLNNKFLHCDISNIKDLPGQAKKAIKKGDILYSEIRPGNGRYLFVDKDLDNYVVSTKFMVIEPNINVVLPEFLFLLLISNETTEYFKMIAESRSGTFPQITFDSVSSLSLNIPDKETQQKILDIITPLDDKIELNTQINQTLEQIAQALFKSWFVDFDPVRAKAQALSDGMSLEQAELAAMQAISGKTHEELTALSQTQPDRYAELAETAKAFPCEMVEVDGVEVPKGWEVKRIDEVIQKIPVGKKYSSKTAFSEGLVPILDQGRSGVIGYHNDKPGVKASIEEPIIVFANHTCYMRLISYDFSAIQNVFAFKGKECNLYWLYLATLGKQEFVEYKGHFPDFLIKEIIVPPEELTELFGKYVKENFSKIFINDRENSNLSKIRDLLLPKLLNGEFIR